ncbi:MAG: HD domain-containing protein [Clostridiales bacterium]|nr:HD domain-containing protein [Clostridiales bacterium]
MKAKDIGKIRKAMEKTLDEKRYEHTLGVAYTAAALAMCYGSNAKQAELAGLLHDCAKCMDNSKKINICKKHNISISEIEYQNPFLLHAKVGSFLAMEKYGIRDKEIINAILNHTTGRPGMSELEKIVYIADYIEPNRKQAPNLSVIRKLAFQDLDAALLKILEDTLFYLNTVDGEIDPMTQKTYEYYKKEAQKV